MFKWIAFAFVLIFVSGGHSQVSVKKTSFQSKYSENFKKHSIGLQFANGTAFEPRVVYSRWINKDWGYQIGTLPYVKSYVLDSLSGGKAVENLKNFKLIEIPLDLVVQRNFVRWDNFLERGLLRPNIHIFGEIGLRGYYIYGENVNEEDLVSMRFLKDEVRDDLQLRRTQEKVQLWGSTLDAGVGVALSMNHFAIHFGGRYGLQINGNQVYDDAKDENGKRSYPIGLVPTLYGGVRVQFGKLAIR